MSVNKHTKRKKGRWFLSLAVLTLGFIVACGASAPPAPAPGAGDTTQPVQAAPTATSAAVTTATPEAVAAPDDAVHPGKVTVMVGGFGNERFIARYCQGECHTFGRLLHGYFATTTHQGGVIPSALESWRMNEDGTQWTLKLRKGIKFHNGEEATIEDALFSLDRMTDFESEVPEQTTTTQAVERRLLVSQEITGPDEITITTKDPYAGLAVWRSDGHAGNLRMNLYPRKLLGEPYEQTEPAYEKLPIGAGPMKMLSRSPGQSMSFERFDDYYYQPEFGAPEDRRPRFQFLDLFMVPELSTRVAALRAGQADLVEAAEAVKSQIEGAGGRLIYAQESTYVTLGLTGCYYPDARCNDIRVRQALDLAVDRETIVNTLYTPESYALAGWNHVTPTSLGYTPELKPTSFQPDKARELMIEAGYKVPGSPGGKDYGKLSIYTWNPGDVPFIPDMAQLVAENWKQELGLDVEVVVTDRTLISDMFRAQELVDKVRLFINEARWDGSTITQSSFNDPENATRTAEDPRLMTMLRDAFDVVDPDKRHDALAKVYPELQAEHYLLSMGHANLPWGVSSRIAEWQPWPVAAFFNAHWTIRLAE